MGLDMYAFSVPASVAGDKQVDIEIPNRDVARELAYWRKFNALHGWMEDLYRAKGGEGPDFNCNTVRLDKPDLDRLTEAIDSNSLKPRGGFFFGAQEIYPEDIGKTREFLQRAREAIEAGKVVLYDSWW